MSSDLLQPTFYDQFKINGYSIIRNLFSAGDTSELQVHTNDVYQLGISHPTSYRHGNLLYEILPREHFGDRYLIQAHWASWASPYFEEFRRRPEFLKVLSPLIGFDIKQVTQQIHWKPPGARMTGYRFHQDLRFRESRDQYNNIVADTVQIAVAIDRSTVNNGCLQIIPRSHTNGYLNLSEDGKTIMTGLTGDEELIAAGLDPKSIVNIELEPGDAAIWNLLTVHGSLPNYSENDRALMISSYVRGETSNRGEWAFRNGVSTSLGERPEICKFEALRENPEPHYIDSKWFLDGANGY